MKINFDNLPDDPDELKRVIEQLQTERQEQAKAVDKLQEEQQELVDRLWEEIHHLRTKLFGRKSEKSLEVDTEQGSLFDFPEADEPGSDPDEAAADGAEDDFIEIGGHKRRRKPGRKPLPPDLPREDIVHDISDEEKHCACGAELVRIGEEVSERLRYIPARTVVERHIRPKYACRCCEGTEDEKPTVKIAPLPSRLLPKTIATPSLVAHILTSKFCDAVPFYRQEKQFARIGVEISRTTMCNWALRVGQAVDGLIEALERHIRSGPMIGMDETTVQVLKELDRAATTKSYMWVFRGGDPGKPGIRYFYAPSRAGRIASEFLGDYQGVVQSDGYKGYGFLDQRNGIVHLGCWAHVRRKFVEVVNANRRDKDAKPKKKVSRAEKIVKLIRRLYKVEKMLSSEDLSDEDFVARRKELANPILADLKEKVEDLRLKTPPGGLLGKAVSYFLGQWPRLKEYVNYAFATPDNNPVENAIRPFVVGRKNWLFSGHAKGAEAGAAIYSLVETAKANGLEPFKYLEYVFERLPFETPKADYDALLPQNLTMDMISSSQ